MDKACNIKRWDLLKRELHNVTAAEVLKLEQENPDLVILDCRKPEEFNKVRLCNAVLMDYFAYDFWDCIQKLPREGHYLVYCNTSRRSTRVCTLMQNGGFEHIYNLEGGLKQWIDELGEEAIVRG